ncbi:TRAP-type C4-dicarboxylate transport system permease small subunit [Rhodobacter aestuarii]|uniref:TRAP transporter small permease protein n=1 Tax=Rhodobacter aestuarii TaxID=453582 RepID=A0A1N7J025_9RHOB|nr:TRAP transporter small permease subunit [Rhodobacter aestuarii]PTV97342.1 TRAP-type C4-dicarboxylate transport system permease small subunit [Rhodobacter aestuarii]SIS42571.1 TRAP-type C4-dicarboxylate transport system, small permease component [Rhodobacter aestuarii]
MSLFGTLSDVLVQLERWASRGLVVLFVGLIAVNVAMRYLAGRPLVFAEELAAILLVWLTLVAVSISIRDKAQIGVTLLLNMLPRRVQMWVDLQIWALIAIMLALLLQAGLGWVTSPSVGFEQVITTGWAKAPFFWIFPIFCLTALVHVLAHLSTAVAVLRGASA